MNVELFKHIDALVAERYASRDTAEQYRATLDPVQFAVEFQTVGVYLPRRAGKSTYIRLRATPMDAIVVHLQCMKREWWRIGTVAPVFAPGDKIDTNQRFHRVYFDEPRLAGGDMFSLIRPFAGRAQQFILLGTP